MTVVVATISGGRCPGTVCVEDCTPGPQPHREEVPAGEKCADSEHFLLRFGCETVGCRGYHVSVQSKLLQVGWIRTFEGTSAVTIFDVSVRNKSMRVG